MAVRGASCIGAVRRRYDPHAYAAREVWQDAVAISDVRLQWDPDHDPHGRPVARRAIQLGLRGPTLARYAKDWIVRVDDITPFVREQAAVLAARGPSALMTPSERRYPCVDPRPLGADPEPA